MTWTLIFLMSIGGGSAEFKIDGYESQAACEQAAQVMLAKQTTPAKTRYSCKAERKA